MIILQWRMAASVVVPSRNLSSAQYLQRRKPFIPTNHVATAKNKRTTSQSTSSSSNKPTTLSPTSKTDNNGTGDWAISPAGFLTGTVAGMLGSLAGMGGGFVMIPMMTSSLIRLTQHQAHGTSLFAVMSTGAAGAVSYGDAVQFEQAIVIALTGMVTARFGAKATSYLSGKRLKQALGVLMLGMAPAIPIKSYYIELANEKEKLGLVKFSNDIQSKTPESTVSLSSSLTSPLQQQSPEPTTNVTIRSLIDMYNTDDNYLSKYIIAPASIGLGSGFLAGLFGVGGGVLVVPALTIFCDMTHYQALGTSLAAMTLPAAIGTYTHYTAGNVAMKVAPFLATGAFVGAYIGGQCGLKTNESTLRWGFSSLLATLGIRTILKA